MACGVVGLAGALTAAAFVAPERTAEAASTYVPRDALSVVAKVPARDAREAAERHALAAAPESLELAVDLARTEISRARDLSDPRYLGRAQALLSRWWTQASPPADVLLLRATIRQSLHQFAAARQDLDQLIVLRPTDPQAHLTRAVVATVTADYAAARESCAALAGQAAPVIAATCMAQLTALAGDVDGAYRALAATVDSRTPASLRAWAMTTLAELAIQRGDDALAQAHLRAILATDPDDAYALAALADITPDPARASALLAGHEQIDNLLVRRAIAEHRSHGRDARTLVAEMRERIDAAATRGDSIHQREEAMFALAVELDGPRAVRLARANWEIQKELTDARLLVEAAVFARDPAAAAPVLEWARRTGVHDTRLERATGRLGGAP
jgi:Tfp pilus assembly protein PilF